MREKGISQRLQSVEEVRASLASHGGRVSARLDARLGPPAGAEGDSTFSYQQQFQQLDSELATIQNDLIAAEDIHVRQQIRISKLITLGDELTEELRNRQVAVRQSLSGLFGSERCFEVAAIKGDTPRARKSLVEQVDLTVKLLRVPEGELPPILVPGIEVDFAGVADGLEDLRGELDATRLELLRENKAGDGTRLAKNEQAAELDRMFPWIASTLESLFRLVGETSLAERIRTSIRRVTRRQDEEGSEEGTAGQSAQSTAGEISAPDAAVTEPEPETSSPAVADPPASPSEAS